MMKFLVVVKDALGNELHRALIDADIPGFDPDDYSDAQLQSKAGALAVRLARVI